MWFRVMWSVTSQKAGGHEIKDYFLTKYAEIGKLQVGLCVLKGSVMSSWGKRESRRARDLCPKSKRLTTAQGLGRMAAVCVALPGDPT